MKKVQALLLAAFISFSLQAQEIDKQASKVEFELTNMLINTVKGTFKGMQGDISFNNDDPTSASFYATVDVATFKTGIKKRDEDMMKEKYFFEEKYPYISFRSEQVIKADAGGYVAIGKLTIKDVTRSVNIPFTVTTKDQFTVLTGKITINRKDYNIGNNTGNMKMGEDVDVTITCVLR